MSSSEKPNKGFTKEEKDAMRERAKELKAEARASKDRAVGERDVLARINEMPEPERKMALRLHKIIMTSAPELIPRAWYGMPAYNKDGKVLCHFQSKSKYETRYSTFSFSDSANIDEGDMWATSFGLTSITDEIETKLSELIKKAVN
jgi:uncharacterized protein YdhG (YjbR/CyaY superfamily)